jgi:hypothetical protein
MVREKIRATQLVNALENHVLGRRKMTASQVSAALGLLRKCVPDLAIMELGGEVLHRHVARLPHVEASTEEWSKRWAKPLLVHSSQKP